MSRLTNQTSVGTNRMARPHLKAVVTMRSSLATLFLVITALLVPASAAAQSSATTLIPGGTAWGTYVKVGSTVTSGRSAVAGLRCGATHDSNNVAAVNASALSAGAVRTRVDAITINGGPGSRSISVIDDVNLLDGLIRADTVKAVSRTSYDGSAFSGGGGASAFSNLRIAGRSYSANASGRVNLPGVGYVLLNHQTAGNGGAMHTTHMVEVHVTQDSPQHDVTAGTVIIVGHALSRLRSVGGSLGGFAFGSHGVVSSGTPLNAEAGRSALIGMPCDGTNGQLHTNQIANVDVPSAFSLSNVQSTAVGDVDATTATVQLTDTIEEADVANGLVHATTVRAVASGAAKNGVRRFSSNGSGFAELSVQGFPRIDAGVPPNTQRLIPGLGVLWLHRVIKQNNLVEVRMIELEVTQSNDLGLPVGADIQVGVARAVIR